MFINPKVTVKEDDCNAESNFFCKLCEFPLRSHDDFSCSKDWNGSCHECYLSFIEGRRKLWKEGWRPDKETLDEYIYMRHKILLPQEKK